MCLVYLDNPGLTHADVHTCKIKSADTIAGKGDNSLVFSYSALYHFVISVCASVCCQHVCQCVCGCVSVCVSVCHCVCVCSEPLSSFSPLLCIQCQHNIVVNITWPYPHLDIFHSLLCFRCQFVCASVFVWRTKATLLSVKITSTYPHVGMFHSSVSLFPVCIVPFLVCQSTLGPLIYRKTRSHMQTLNDVTSWPTFHIVPIGAWYETNFFQIPFLLDIVFCLAVFIAALVCQRQRPC